MKKVFALLLLALLTFSLVACAGDGAPDGMKDVAVENAAYRLYVPTSWVSNTGGGVSGAYVSSSDASNVTVTTALLPEAGMTAASYWNEVCLPAYESGEALKDFSQIGETEETTLGGRDAVKATFVFTVDGENYEVTQVVTVFASNVYTLTYTALSVDFGEHAEEVESIVSEFVFR